MSFPWFARVGVLYFPKTVIGWLILLAALADAVYEFIVVDARSHSASDTLINWFFRLLIIGVVYALIGFLTSREARRKRRVEVSHPVSVGLFTE